MGACYGIRRRTVASIFRIRLAWGRLNPTEPSVDSSGRRYAERKATPQLTKPPSSSVGPANSRLNMSRILATVADGSLPNSSLIAFDTCRAASARTIPHALGSSHVVGRTAQTSPPFATHARKTSTGLCISRNFTRDQRIPSALHGAILPLLCQGNHKTQGPNNLPTGDDYAGVVTQYDLKTKASLC